MHNKTSRRANLRVVAGTFLVLGSCILPVHADIARAEVLFFQDTENYSPETARSIKKVKLDQRYFGRINTKDGIAYFSVTADQGTQFELELDTPKADNDFKPTMVFFGPGLAEPKEDAVVPLGEGNGAIVSRAEDGGNYYDRSTFTRFNIGPRIKIALPMKATYAIAIRSPNGETGRFALKIKGRDDFKWGELTGRLAAQFRAIFRMY